MKNNKHNLIFNFKNCSVRTGVGKLRPAGQVGPAMGKSLAREHVFILNGMWPANENSAARDHVNVARRTKLF